MNKTPGYTGHVYCWVGLNFLRSKNMFFAYKKTFFLAGLMLTFSVFAQEASTDEQKRVSKERNDKGMVFYREKNYESAKKMFQSSIDSYPRNIEAQLNLGIT